MTVIGVCGSSGSGKSQVCKLLQNKGCYIFDCDEVYAGLTTPPSQCLDEIAKHFGSACLCPDGTLNRPYLASLIYPDAKKREELNGITFRHITQELFQKIQEKKREGESAFVIDAPLLFESGLNTLCHHIIGVIAPEKMKLSRLCKRDQADEALLKQRIAAQKSDSFLKEHCDFIVENLGSLKELDEKIASILRCIIV